MLKVCITIQRNGDLMCFLSLHRCLNPGRYAQNLERWLSYFPPQQLLILDGEELRDDPVAVMYRLQRFLQIQPLFDYSTKLR